METNNIFSAGFWENIWQQKDQYQKQKNSIAGWNNRAEEYYHNVASPSGHKRVQETLSFLNTYGLLKEKLRILDIGSGPGNFTLAFAALGHEVVALDPAEEMLGVLKEKLQEKPELQQLVTTVAADWHTLSLNEYDWLGQFDLVFASLTPGVSNPATLIKAMQASRKYVFLSLFAGERELSAINEISHQLLGEPFQKSNNDALLPFIWLYTKGYRPALHFAHWEHNLYQTADEAVYGIGKMLGTRLEITSQVEQFIREYVEKHLDDHGYFSEQRKSTAAMLLWDVNKTCLTLAGS
ncbi:MAG: class I SAM-dependent methyltransferase [Firmicutes bacterium]|nr:class I SAM-dependent methyltransferase [Bacillota bacterium]